MPGKESKHTAKWDRCVKKVKEKNPDVNPYAICSASIEDAGLKKKYQRRPKSEYYANRKKRKMLSERYIKYFEEFINEGMEDLYHEIEYSRHSDDDDEYMRRQKEIEDEYYYKAEELYREFINEHDGEKNDELNKYDLEYIKLWLAKKHEPISFATYIYYNINKK